MSKVIMGIKLMERMNSASRVQELLSEYGCEINTRIGLHTAAKDACSPDGLILLDFIDNSNDRVVEFEEKLKDIAEVEVQKMVFK